MSDNFTWITAILSIILAIATAALKTFKFQENWGQLQNDSRIVEEGKNIIMMRKQVNMLLLKIKDSFLLK